MTSIHTISPEQTWPIRHQVMWPNKPLEYVKLPKDEQGLHFGLFVGDELTSVISLFIEGSSAQFRKFATQIDQQGKGYGSQLLKDTLEQAKSKGIDRIWCNSRIEKAGYYTRFGMRHTDQRFSKGGQDYVIMERYF